MMARVLLLLLVAAFWAPAPAQAQNDKVRIAFNPGIYNYLPIYLAMDLGYFTDEKIDIEFTTYGGSSLTMLPLMVRGDLDITPMAGGPGFFNQHTSGFAVKLIASTAQARPGWHDTIWLMVRKDLHDQGAIKTLADLKGRVVEGGPRGSPIFLLTTQALREAGLATRDVTFTERLRAVSDVLPLFRNKAIDVISMVEPMAMRLEEEGLAVRWKPSYEIMPWFQEAFLAAAPKMYGEKRDVTRRFLKAFLRGAQKVAEGGGKWTPQLVASLSKWSKMPEDLIRKIPGPAHAGQMGQIDVASLERQQDIWVAEGMLKDKVRIADIVDTGMLDEARRELGIK